MMKSHLGSRIVPRIVSHLPSTRRLDNLFHAGVLRLCNFLICHSLGQEVVEHTVLLTGTSGCWGKVSIEAVPSLVAIRPRRARMAAYGGWVIFAYTGSILLSSN